MAVPMPQDDAAHPRGVSRRDRADGLVAGPWLRQATAVSPQQEVLSRAGQLILEWAVEVARYEADIDWQWIHKDGDPAVTAAALARLIHETRSVADRAEALLITALPDEDI